MQLVLPRVLHLCSPWSRTSSWRPGFFFLVPVFFNLLQRFLLFDFLVHVARRQRRIIEVTLRRPWHCYRCSIFLLEAWLVFSKCRRKLILLKHCVASATASCRGSSARNRSKAWKPCRPGIWNFSKQPIAQVVSGQSITMDFIQWLKRRQPHAF